MGNVHRGENRREGTTLDFQFIRHLHTEQTSDGKELSAVDNDGDARALDVHLRHVAPGARRRVECLHAARGTNSSNRDESHFWLAQGEASSLKGRLPR